MLHNWTLCVQSYHFSHTMDGRAPSLTLHWPIPSRGIPGTRTMPPSDCASVCLHRDKQVADRKEQLKIGQSRDSRELTFVPLQFLFTMGRT